MSVRKTRNLSIYELFEILQKEYIVCKLRFKIYPYQSHKEYWLRVAEKKKEKILDIAERNKLPNIFSDDNIKKVIEHSIYGVQGVPNFIYRDDEHRKKQEKWDLINYFFVGSNVRVNVNGKNEVAKIHAFDDLNKKVITSLGTYNMNEVTRIL